MKVISLGMGVQSTALYLMSCNGDLPRADYAIFADPGAEHKDTYNMLEWLLAWVEKNNGIPIIINKENNLLRDLMKKQNMYGGRWSAIPAFGESGGMMRRQCTADYKIKPVIKSIRRLHNLKPYKRMKPTELWLGISIDEASRMKDSRHFNIKHKFPLIEKYFSRSDCVNYFKNNKFPIPSKSSCVFCPYHSGMFWKQIKKENGSAWKISLKVDKTIRDLSQHGINDKIYLHPSLKPLDEVDFNENQVEMFDNECEGHCGL